MPQLHNKRLINFFARNSQTFSSKKDSWFIQTLKKKQFCHYFPHNSATDRHWYNGNNSTWRNVQNTNKWNYLTRLTINYIKITFWYSVVVITKTDLPGISLEVGVEGMACGLWAGPQILTVLSSDTLAIIEGFVGFQWTQLTVCLCPSNRQMGFSSLICHM